MEHKCASGKSNVDSKKPEETSKNGVGNSKDTNTTNTIKSPNTTRTIGTKSKCTVLAKNQGVISSLLLRISRIWPLKYVFEILKKIASFAGLTDEVETVGIADQTAPKRRRFLSGRKRIGRLTRLILFVTPYRLQCALGYHTTESIGKTKGSDEIRKSPLKPCGKGNKRKQDDVEVEEEFHSWVTFMTEDLPDEDQDDDPTYEPSKSDTDSEENRSKNDTESDLEVEEKDGTLMLKVEEYPEDIPAHKEQIQEEKTSNNEEQKTNAE